MGNNVATGDVGVITILADTEDTVVEILGSGRDFLSSVSDEVFAYSFAEDCVPLLVAGIRCRPLTDGPYDDGVEFRYQQYVDLATGWRPSESLRQPEVASFALA